jgi:glutamate carboxypeptidase
MNRIPRLFLAALALAALPAMAQPVAPVLAQATANRQPMLDTLRDLVNIESGSDDREGLDRISDLIFQRLKALGGTVEFIEPGDDAYRMEDTPAKIGRMVKATFRGTGTKKILLIAHMDTVYRRGMLARQPFRVDAEKAYGLAISDDKQGVATIIQTVAMLNALSFRRDRARRSPSWAPSTTPRCPSRPRAPFPTSFPWPPPAWAA